MGGSPRADYPIYFDGFTYEPPKDESRLRTQLWRVFVTMTDEREHTLAELAETTGGSEASVSARLRDLRKPRFGAWVIQRRRIVGGLFGYRLERRSPRVEQGALL
jgi:hypothetical protein